MNANKYSNDIREGCKHLIIKIKNEKFPPKFKVALIDWCIWKYTTCEFVFSSRGKNPDFSKNELMGDKYAARHYSKAAFEILKQTKSKSSISGLRFDHVWERRDLCKEISKGGYSEKIFERFVGCVVTNGEHGNLTHRSKCKKLKGWKRYKDGQIIFMYCDKTRRHIKCLVKNGRLIICRPLVDGGWPAN